MNRPPAPPARTEAGPAAPSPLKLILLALSLVLAAIQLVRWGLFLHLPGYADIGDYYLYASMGLHHGWNTLYNLEVEQQEWQALGGVTVLPNWPMIYPPPLAWLVVPFTFLPFRLALAIWALLILALFLWIWTVTARGPLITRWTLLAAAIGVFPVAYGLMLGQILIVSLAAVVAAWWLLGRGHELAAGLVLTLIVVKPQIAFLVPAALLLMGYWRTVGVWACGTALVVGLAAVSLGPEGVHVYLSRLHDAANGAPDYLVLNNLTVAGLLGRGLAGLAAQIVVSALTLVAAYRQRRHGPQAAVVAGLVGSVLVTPYVHLSDVTVFFPAAWLYLSMNPPRLPRMVLVLGYLAMLPSILYLAPQDIEPALTLLGMGGVAILAIAWLILMAWPLDLHHPAAARSPARLAA